MDINALNELIARVRETAASVAQADYIAPGAPHCSTATHRPIGEGPARCPELMTL
jgi:hypothetical protein